MPVVSVGRDKLFEALGRSYTDDEFQELCFDYGIELDDVTSEKEMVRKELGLKDAAVEADEEILYKIDIPANRYDMLCLEGIARALNIFLGRIPSPSYRVAEVKGRPLERIIVKPETLLVRPFVVAAVLRGVQFDPTRYKSFIDLQDKLHQNLCRQRSLVAIGTHDLATVKGPFTYEALPPSQIKFTPLKQTEEFTAEQLVQHYLKNDQKLKKYVPIIAGSVVYPVIYDANRTVLSLPPIINGAHSQILLDTRDVLIECTATDLTKAKIVLQTVCAMFSEHCSTPCEVEPVAVVDAFGETTVYPDMSARNMEVAVEYINHTAGINLPGASVAQLLSKMQLSATVVEGGEAIRVAVPVTRSDILHPCDIVEDVAIAYGYNNITKTMPQAATVGSELPLNQLSDGVRVECGLAGWTEIMTWALQSRHENFDAVRQADNGSGAVSIGNPATLEFEVVRTSLIPGALKTLSANRDSALPIKLFEVSDVVLMDSQAETGCRNQRRLVALYCNKDSGFEVIHGLLNRVMDVLGVAVKGEDDGGDDSMCGGYEWRPCENYTFFPGRQAEVYHKDQGIGFFGVVHPYVLENFDIKYPVSALEIDLEPFCYDQFFQPLPTHFH